MKSRAEIWKELIKFGIGKNRSKTFRIGDIYWDCSYHPVLCTSANYWDLEGISLIDGTYPRCCSIRQCGITKINLKQALFIKSKWSELQKETDRIMKKFRKI
jgi:hypothetical protein